MWQRGRAPSAAAETDVAASVAGVVAISTASAVAGVVEVVAGGVESQHRGSAAAVEQLSWAALFADQLRPSREPLPVWLVPLHLWQWHWVSGLGFEFKKEGLRYASQPQCAGALCN